MPGPRTRSDSVAVAAASCAGLIGCDAQMCEGDGDRRKQGEPWEIKVLGRCLRLTEVV